MYSVLVNGILVFNVYLIYKAGLCTTESAFILQTSTLPNCGIDLPCYLKIGRIILFMWTMCKGNIALSFNEGGPFGIAVNQLY